ncbi:MAG TPA: rhomboid family intramembrane serine protease [Chitinophagaceae bacterium]|nr:rhomboid family intramembrane serine protease [Chitinophagaceae bacterium]
MPYTENQYRQKITLGQSGNSLMTLIAVCLITFVSFAFLKAVWYFRFPKETALAIFNKNVLGWFVMPADFNALLSKPWTILTHMFVYDNIWRVFSNMLWLWSFGYIMQDLTGNRKIVPVFIYGSLGGAIAFLLAYNFLPSLHLQLPFAVLNGGAAGVMALAIATTIVSPGYRLFPMIGGGIPLWVLTLVYVISDLATVSISDTGTLVTHLAGAFTGFLFMFFLRRGHDWSNWMNNLADWVNNLFNPDKPKKDTSIKDELFYRSDKAPFKKTPHVTQERIDEILDKINQKGYHFLTAEEKEILKRAREQEF